MEWPLLSCVACHDLVEAIKESHELGICRLQVWHRRAERDPELSFHECMEWPLLSRLACHDLLGPIRELHRIYAEPSPDELMEWLLRLR